MKRKNKKIMLISIEPTTKEMLRYKAYKSNKSQNRVIEEVLKSGLEKGLEKDKNFIDLFKKS